MSLCIFKNPQRLPFIFRTGITLYLRIQKWTSEGQELLNILCIFPVIFAAIILWGEGHSSIKFSVGIPAPEHVWELCLDKTLILQLPLKCCYFEAFGNSLSSNLPQHVHGMLMFFFFFFLDSCTHLDFTPEYVL